MLDINKYIEVFYKPVLDLLFSADFDVLDFLQNLSDI